MGSRPIRSVRAGQNIYLVIANGKTMINIPKLTAFIIATIMLIVNIYMFGVVDNWIGIIFLLVMYLSLILVALYDIGKDEVD